MPTNQNTFISGQQQSHIPLHNHAAQMRVMQSTTSNNAVIETSSHSLSIPFPSSSQQRQMQPAPRQDHQLIYTNQQQQQQQNPVPARKFFIVNRSQFQQPQLLLQRFLNQFYALCPPIRN